MSISVTLVAQMFTFVVLIWLINRYLWGPLTDMMARRQKRIADGLAAAEAGRNALVEAQAREEEILALARERASEILDRAERRAHELVEEARAHAKEEGALLLAMVRTEAATEMQRAREQLRTDVARLALLAAERIVAHEVDRRVHEKLLHEVMDQL